jgi:hypothetical protein
MDVFLALALSTHFNLVNSYNTFHPHIRVEKDNLIAGAYVNSLYTVSSYIGVKYTPVDPVYVEVGGITGYPDINVFGRVGYLLNDYNIFVAPGLEGDRIGLIFGLEYQYKLGD